LSAIRASFGGFTSARYWAAASVFVQTVGVGVAVAVAVALGVGSAVITAALGVGVVAAVGAADEQAASARTAARESRRYMVVPSPVG
jgi:tRNA A58 N-methylase Trm61